MIRGKMGLTVVALVGGLVMLTGCEEGTLVYQGVERPVSEIEEIMSDQLEVENPSEDLSISIVPEVED